MSELNWLLILKIKEFDEYFNSKELIELSSCCKGFRDILKSRIFNSIKFTSYVEANNYKSYTLNENEIEESEEEEVDNRNEENFERNFAECTVIYDREPTPHIYLHNPYEPLNEEFHNSKEQFKSDLKLSYSKPNQLELYNCKDYYYLLQDIPNVFSKLTTLLISNSHINIEVLQYLLDNLTSLEKLELTRIYLLQYSQDETQSAINWPTTLKNMKFYDNFASFVKDKHRPIITYSGELTNTSNQNLKLTPKYLPKLTSFECRIFGDPDIDFLIKFLKLNPQIKNLKLGGDSLTRELFDCIKSCENLNNLGLSYFRYYLNESELKDLPIINTITSLYIYIWDSYENLDNIIHKLPNLTNTIIEDGWANFDNLFDLAIKIPKTRGLVLKTKYTWAHSIYINFPKLDNLISLELLLHNFSEYDNINLNFENCTNIELVKFEEMEHENTNDNLKLNPILTGTWKAVKFPKKFTYYRDGK